MLFDASSSGGSEWAMTGAQAGPDSVDGVQVCISEAWGCSSLRIRASS